MKNSSNASSNPDMFPVLDEAGVIFSYDPEGQSTEPTASEPTPRIFCDSKPGEIMIRQPDLAITSRHYESMAESAIASTPYSWTGREFDVETELQYNRVGRWYDPTPGRFLEEAE